ncbi:MAG: hypothetical protein LC789_14625 [Actinobacteria bacterium]|nr:hypothetical protein [Actinomycetota bacterium]MCA1721341.1 hypothetical protein [Actinomycetota bacterium]
MPRDTLAPGLLDIAVRAAVAASPRLAGSLSVIYEGLRDRHVARAADVMAEAAAGIGPDELAARLAGDEELDAAFAAAVEAGARSGLPAKRLLLGQVVNRAVLDDALTDEAVLLVGVLAQIDAPHVRCLELIRRAQDEAAAAGEVHERAPHAEREIVHRINAVGSAQPAPVLVLLRSLGLLDASGSYDGEVLVKGLTPFGERLLADLAGSGG